ncbi:unnamed protein product [Sphagnum jensenii]|uniref:Uncharacterized protein n=1 Tax=Sphagnum jensenii TaxID=128206 RepID=A0ABP0X1Z8_9BRYO
MGRHETHKKVECLQSLGAQLQPLGVSLCHLCPQLTLGVAFYLGIDYSAMPSIISQFKPNQQLHMSKFEETHAESLDHVSESLGCSFAPIQMLDTFPDQVAILPAL